MGGKKAVKRQTRHDRLDDERSERELFEERHQQALYESSSCHGQD
ncbi:hypothetical protein [Paraburkholderia hospita]|nr:hypothetical protein [Paraburkholderia hospita]